MRDVTMRISMLAGVTSTYYYIERKKWSGTVLLAGKKRTRKLSESFIHATNNDKHV